MGSGKPRTAKRETTSTTKIEELFQPLTPGEKAMATRVLLEDPRVASMAKVGRYQVISAEPWVPKLKKSKPKRAAKLVVYDYALNKTIQAFIDIENIKIDKLIQNSSQPMLSKEEECKAIKIASSDSQIASALAKDESLQAVLHYWSSKESEQSYNQRSAALVFGDKEPTLVAIVNLNNASVIDVVPAHKW